MPPFDGQPQQQGAYGTPEPFNWAQGYSPLGNIGFQPSDTTSMAMGLLVNPFLQQFAGPTNFLPHQFAGQATFDQFTMRNYQMQTRMNTMRTDHGGDNHVAETLLGMRSVFTNNPATALNKEQAASFAGMINSPVAKAALGSMMGPENLEALMFGRRGDVSALAAAANRIGYYRKDPDSGADRMDAQSLEDFSRGLHAHLYEPTGNIDAMTRGVAAVQPITKAQESEAEYTTRLNNDTRVHDLKQSAGLYDKKLIGDDIVTQRMTALGDDKVAKLYAQHAKEGKAVGMAARVKELTKIAPAVAAASVINADETSIAELKQAAVQASKPAKVAATFSAIEAIAPRNNAETPAEYTTRLNSDTRVQELKKEAGLESKELLGDDTVAQRMTALGAKKVATLYKEHAKEGKAKNLADRVKELTKIAPAVAAASVINADETSIAELKQTVAQTMPADTVAEAVSNVSTIEPQRDAISPAEYATRIDKNAQVKELKKEAGLQDKNFVRDEVLAKRMTALGHDKVKELYEAHAPTGTALTSEARANELVKIDAAVKSSGVVQANETALAELKQVTAASATPEKVANMIRNVEAVQAPAGPETQEEYTSRINSDKHVKALKKAAGFESKELLGDDTITQRLEEMDKAKSVELYQQYVGSKGTATTNEERAKELVKFDSAVKRSGVVQAHETSLAALKDAAENANANNMHGFTAGSAAQIAENMMQRGILPQSLGAMSAADRVKLIQQDGTDTDDETMNRLAREFGHRDLEKNSDEYRGKDKHEREKMLDANLDGYKTKLKGTFDKLKAVDTTKSSGEIENEVRDLEGMSSFTGNVDSKRAAKVLKDQAGALSAIREIFGDNGNPNAPVPALLAALDHLSQGAVGQVGAKKVEGSLRQMRLTAKEMGIGFDQLAGFSAQMGAYGDTLGLSAPAKLNATNAALSMVNTMRQDGAFANTQFGSMSQAEALQKVGMLAARGEASGNAKAGAALVRAYETDPEKFKDNAEFKSIVEALKDPDKKGEYTDAAGNKKNIYTELGTKGPMAAMEIATRAGISSNQFGALFQDTATQQYQSGVVGLMSQRAEFENVLGQQLMAPTLAAGLKGSSGPLNAATAEAVTQRQSVTKALSAMMIDIGDKSDVDRVNHIQDNAKTAFADALKKTTPKTAGESDADYEARVGALADNAYQGFFGADPAEQRANITQVLAQANTQSVQMTGTTLTGQNQLYGQDRLGNFAKEQTRKKNEAEDAKRLGVNMETNYFMRTNEYFAKIGRSGENFNAVDFISSVTGITDNKEIMEKIAPEYAAAVGELRKKSDEASLTPKYLTDLETRAAAGDKDAINEVTAIAGRTGDYHDKSIVGKDEVKAAQKAKLSERQIVAATGEQETVEARDARVKKLYDERIKGGKATTADSMITELTEFGNLTEAAGFTPPELRASEHLGANTVTLAEAMEAANESTGHERGVTDAERAANLKIKDAGIIAEQAMSNGGGESNRKEAMAALGRKILGLEGDELINLQEEAMKNKVGGEKFEGTDEFEALLDKSGASESDKKLARTAREAVAAGVGLNPAAVKSVYEQEKAKKDKADQDFKDGKAPATEAATQSMSGFSEAIKSLTDTVTKLKSTFDEMVPKGGPAQAGDAAGAAGAAANTAATGSDSVTQPPPPPAGSPDSNKTVSISGTLVIPGLRQVGDFEGMLAFADNVSGAPVRNA